MVKILTKTLPEIWACRGSPRSSGSASVRCLIRRRGFMGQGQERPAIARANPRDGRGGLRRAMRRDAPPRGARFARAPRGPT